MHNLDTGRKRVNVVKRRIAIDRHSGRLKLPTTRPVAGALAKKITSEIKARYTSPPSVFDPGLHEASHGPSYERGGADFDGFQETVRAAKL
jgi:hypothetical protein